MKVPPFYVNFKRQAGNLAGYLMVCLVACFFIHPEALRAEGSKDFVNNPGYRMFLDTRDPQQFKVYANVGETINVGASHLGFSGGFITVYRPDGTVARTFDNTGATTNLGIIYDNIQELNGPTGGGTTNGNGYIPGTVTVGAGQAGIWTVVFNFPTYVDVSFINILNSLPWTRGINQPISPRAILAWDVTVTSNGAGNTGGTARQGRLFTQEFITLINNNGFETSASLIVLTPDGYQYQINIDRADPFRFPISSNSRGLVDSNRRPIYRSKDREAFTRSSTPQTWQPGSIYLYEPQAKDVGRLINNKIFFNVPDPTMPSSATVFDVNTSESYSSWLYRDLRLLSLSSFTFIGIDPGGVGCLPWTLEHLNGGYFHLETSVGGTATVFLDLNNNGVFNDPIDTQVTADVLEGKDSIFWNGRNGLGNFLALNDSLRIRYKVNIKFGELHIAMTDVENLSGGVKFKWRNAPPGFADSLAYYDHSDIGGPVSGGGTPGNALPTATAFTYSSDFGDNKYLDQWFFIEHDLAPQEIILSVVADCPCSNAAPKALKTTTVTEFCSGQSVTLSATNTKTGIGNLKYNWTGPNGFAFSETIGASDTSKTVLSNLTTAHTGNYLFFVESNLGCRDSGQISIIVNPVPSAASILGGGAYCPGSDVTLTALNTVAGITSINYTWSGPNGFTATGSGAGSSPISVTIPAIPNAAQGTYTLNMTSDKLCAAAPLSAVVTVTPIPALFAVSGGGKFCERANVALSATNSNTAVTSMICTWTGPNGFSSTQTIAGTATANISLTGVTPAQSGIYTLICVTDGCPGPALNFNVEVTAAPLISSLSPDGNFCSGSSVSLTATNSTTGTGPLDYTWSGPSFTFSGNAPEAGPFNAVIPNVTTANAGAFTLVLQTADGCQSLPGTVNVAVLPSPVIENISGGGDACTGSTVVLSATNSVAGTGPIIFTWTGPSGVVGAGVAPSGGPFTATLSNVQPSQSGVYTLTLQADNSSCVAPAKSVTLNVLSGLTLTNLSPNQTVCEGTRVVLTATNTVASGEVTYTWTGPNGFTFTKKVAGSVPFDLEFPAITPAQAGDYSLSLITSSGCIYGPGTVNVTVTPGFYVTSVPAVGTHCEGSNVVLTANGTGSAASVNYSWSGPCGFNSTGTITNPASPLSSTINNIGANCSGQYTLTVTSAGGCNSAPSNVNVTVAPKPVISDILGGGTFCKGTTATLTFKNTGGNDSVRYTYIVNGVSTKGTAIGANDIKITLTESATVSASFESFNGCLSASKSAQVVFLPVTKPVVTPAVQLCQGVALSLNGTNAEPGTGTVSYTWTGPGGYTFTGSAPWAGPFPATVANPVSGNYCLKVTSNGTCTPVEVCTQFTLNPKPSITGGGQGGGSFCTGANTEIVFTVALNGAPSATFNIKGPGLDSTRTVTTGTTVRINVRVGSTTAGTYTITLVSNQNCSADPASVTITEKRIVQAVLTSSALIICQGASLTLTTNAQTGPNVSYEWYKDGLRIGTTTTPTFTVTNATAGKYSVIGLADGCSSTSAEVTVSQIPTPIATGDSFEGEVGVPVKGSVSANDNSGGRPVTYTITSPPINGTASIDASGNMTYTPRPGFAGPDQFTYRICLTDCPALCATAVVNLKIVQTNCIVPNVITPNGDGVNDVLVILCLENQTYPNNIFHVYNRWGDEVFVAEPYRNNWDGTSGKDNKELPASTYYYILKLDKAKSEIKAGYIKIVR